MSGIIPFDSLFPVASEPLVSHRLFGFNPVENKNEGITIAQILSLLGSSAPAWSEITGKPSTFAPSAHTIGSHSDASADFDAAPDGRILRKISGKWTPWAPDFLTEETDPTVPAHVKGITSGQISNWQTAFSWGNHAGQYRPVSWVPAWGDISGKPSTFAPSAHALADHSDAEGLAAAPDGYLLKKISGKWTAWAPNFLDTSYSPPPDPTIPAEVRGITLGEISAWNQKALEFADFPDYSIPVYFQGIPQNSGITGVFSENPYSPEDPEYDPAFLGELLRIDFSVPVKGVPATDPSEFVTKSQLPQLVQYGKLSGGTIQWNGTGFEFDWSAAILAYPEICNAPANRLTLDAAHATLNRVDLLGWIKTGENTAAPHVITGTPAASFNPPPYDPASFIVGIPVNIPAASTSPAGVNVELIYLDNAGQWTPSSSGTGTSNPDSTTAPISGAKSVEVSNPANNFKQKFTRPTVLDLSTLGAQLTFGFEIKLKASLTNTQNLALTFLDAANNPVSNQVFLSFNKTSLTAQFIALALSQFTFTGNEIKALEITYLQKGGGTHPGFFLDNIKIQGDLLQPVEPTLTPEIIAALFAASSPGAGNAFATVGQLFSGNYEDLAGKPTLFSGNYADLSGKPSLFSGNYADLAGKPALFDGNYSSLSGVPSTFAPSAHNHPLSQLTQSGATEGQVPVWNGTAWAPGTVSGGGGGGGLSGLTTNRIIKAISATTVGNTGITEESATSYLFGSRTSEGLLNPLRVSFGASYGTSTPGSPENLKWVMWDNGTPAERYGIGMSFNLMELRAPANAEIGYFVNGGEVARYYYDSFVSRIKITHPSNSGFRLFIGTTGKWSVATYGTNSDFVIYNETLNRNSIFVKGDNNRTIISELGNIPADLGYPLYVVGNTAGLGLVVGGQTWIGGDIQIIKNSGPQAQPTLIQMGTSYGTNTPGAAGNLKWKLYTTTGFPANANDYGIGMSAGLMELRAGSGASIGFFPNNGVELMRLISGGFVTIGVNANPANTRFTVRGLGTTTGVTQLLEASDGTDNVVFLDNGQVRFLRLPTAATGLAAGTLWNDAGTLKVA